MIELSEEYKQNITNRYEEKGVKWLDSINVIIEKYREKFNLYDIKLAKNLSMNIVLFANSNEYGEVVLKIGQPGKTSISEINYMSQYSSKHLARCYYYDINDRVMILEKVNPGYQLNKLKDQEERIRIFCNILKEITTKEISKNNFRSYEEKIKEKIKLLYSDSERYSSILYMIDIVNNLYSEISNMNLPQYVIHNDLHHKNILKSSDGWKVIDPHGLVGERVFDTAQFIRAELEESNLDEIDKIITLISKYLNEDKTLIYKALYITTFEKIVFFIQAKYDESTIAYNIELSEKISQYI